MKALKNVHSISCSVPVFLFMEISVSWYDVKQKKKKWKLGIYKPGESKTLRVPVRNVPKLAIQKTKPIYHCRL